MGGGTGAKLGGIQRLPLAPGAQDKENGIHTYPIGSARPAAAKAVGVYVFGNEPLNLRPQIVGDAPVLGYHRIAHG